MAIEMKPPSLDAILDAQASWLREANASDERARLAATRALAGLSAAARQLLANLALFSYPQVAGLQSSTSGLGERIAQLERAVRAQIPPALRLFWEVVGGLSLVDLSNYAHVEFWRGHGLPSGSHCCDGVHIYYFDQGFLQFSLQDFEERPEDPDVSPSDLYSLSLSPDGYHKDDISGGAPYEIQTGGGWLAPLQNFGWSGPTRPRSSPENPCDLISYLRSALLECAGFPGLYGAQEFEPIRLRLLRGVTVF